MTQTIRTALLGFGHAGAIFHAPSLASVAAFHLAVIVCSDPARQAQARATYPQATVLSRAEWARHAATLELDLLVVATPPATHGVLARAALEAGRAVVVDKPFTANAAEAAALIALAERRGLLLSTYQNRRWDGEFLTLRRLVAEGALGRVHRFEARLERWQPDPSAKAWKARATPADGGGILYDLGTHLIDQALQLFGPAERVYGEVATRRAGERSDDDAFVALHHAGGVVSHLWMNLTAAQRGPRLRVLGSRAAYVKEQPDQQEAQLLAGLRPGEPGYGRDRPEHWGLLGRDGTAVPIRTEPANFSDYYAMLAQALLHGGPAPVDPQDSLATLRIIEQVRQHAPG